MSAVRATLNAVAERLAGVSETPDFEAELLLLHTTGWSRAQLLGRMDAEVDGERLEPLIARRLAHEPIAYILGAWEFYSLEVAVEAPLLVPRPETEHLVEIALSHMGSAPCRVLDVCTGTGCVALAIVHQAPTATVLATDIHPVAVRVAAANARRHERELPVFQGDLFAALPADTPSFHVIVSNPPYVETTTWDDLAPDIRNYEDPGALLSGTDGLDCIRRIITEAPDWLLPGGLLALEMGESQGAAVLALLEARGFVDCAMVKDLAGHDRIAHGIFPASI